MIEPKAVSKLAAHRMNDIAIVTRAQAFTSAAAKLANASTRLDTEAQHQSKYWGQLASLRSNGWPVSRMPNNTRALVVHYGMAESSPQYRNKGIAALRQDDIGDLTFAGQAESEKPKFLSITVHRKGAVTGRFDFRQARPVGRSKLDEDLFQAREALFQEELFTEASKEARLLANMGVKTRSSSIEIQISDECSMALSYAKAPFERQEESQIDGELADFVGNGLRLMLVAEHQHKYLQRAEHKSPPMSPTPRVATEYALLRPIVSLLRHQCETAPLFETLRKYEKSLQQAGLALSFGHSSKNDSRESGWALQALRRAVMSQVIIALPTKQSISIKVETHLAAPRFGTQFNSMQYHSPCGTSFCAETSSHKNVVQFLGDVLSRDICTLILGSEECSNHWQLHSKYPPQLVLAHGNEKDRSTTLAVTCFNGRIAISYGNEQDSSKEYAKWDGQEVGTNGKDVQRGQTEKGLLEVVRLWSAKLVA